MSEALDMTNNTASKSASRSRRLFASLLVVVALASGSEASASTATAATTSDSEISASGEARARRARAPRKARARRVCSGRGKARRCTVVHPAAPAPAAPGAPAPAPAPAAGPAHAPAGGGDPAAFGFLFPNAGRPGRWNPCDVVRYRVNANRAPAGAVADLDEAIRRVSEASGVRFVNDGATNEMPQADASGNYSNTSTIIAWAAPGESSMLHGSAAGIGGAAGVYTPDGRIRLTRGFVVIDAGAPVAPGFGGGATQGALLLHELGHMVGLDHSGDRGQIMFSTVSSTTPPSWGAGDRNGLTQVGAQGGCF